MPTGVEFVKQIQFWRQTDHVWRFVDNIDGFGGSVQEVEQEAVNIGWRL